MDLTGLGSVFDFGSKILDKIFPDPAQKAQAQLELLKQTQAGEFKEMDQALAVITAQTDINKAEAASTDPLQHWRGGLGWVCVAGYGYNFVVMPLMVAAAALAGHPLALNPLEIGPLVTLTLGMLGLGGLHVTERVKGAT